jgi:Ca2+-binding EF-hand superfamily protein
MSEEKNENFWKKALIGASVATVSFLGFYYWTQSSDEVEKIEVKKNISLRKAKVIFDEYDLDKNGKLNKNELSNYIENISKKFKMKLSEEQKNEIFKKIHHADDGEINFEEFALWLNTIAE